MLLTLHRNTKRTFAEHPRGSQCWSNKNHPLRPEHFALNSRKKVWLNCDKCPHTFDISCLNANAGKWCQYCCTPQKKLCDDIKCNWCNKRSCASLSDKIKNAWMDSNDKTPCEVLLGSEYKVSLFCANCEHIFEKLANTLKKGSWCSYCSKNNWKWCGKEGCEFCHNKSMAASHRVNNWSDKNKKKPHEVSICAAAKYWFNCNKCIEEGAPYHLFEVAPSKISTYNCWCKYCSSKWEWCGKKGCEVCRKRSVASQSCAKYWSPNNKKKPYEVPLASNIKYLFICPECKQEWGISPNNIKHGNWCSCKKNKTETKLLKWLQKQPFKKKVKHQYKPKWCSTEYHCIMKGEHKTRRYQYSYDYLITLENEKQLIIELDGAQHYVDNIYFKTTALHQQIRDAYKERKARQHKLKVIRILQEDVYYDRNDWESNLIHMVDSC